MSRSIIKWVLFVCLLHSVGIPVRADTPAESDNLRAIVRELDNLRYLVDSSATMSLEHEQRLRFNYTYVLDALDYLASSATTHVQIRNSQSTEQWDLNQRKKLSVPKTIIVVAPATNRRASGSTEQERLGDIAREIELIKTVVKRASSQAGQQRSRVSFDYGYMLNVLSYLDYAVRAHLSLQNSVPRTQWDRNRRIRLSPETKAVLE